MRRFQAVVGAHLGMQDGMIDKVGYACGGCGLVCDDITAVIGDEGGLERLVHTCPLGDAWFAERVPSAHLRIGSKIEGHDTAIHRPDFRLNERIIPLGTKLLSRAVLDLMEHRQASAA